MSQEQVSKKEDATSTVKIVAISVVSTVLVIVLGAYLWVNYLFPSQFDPVELSTKEAIKLDQKLNQINLKELSVSNAPSPSAAKLTPQAYRENNALRRVAFSEREVNALLAHNTDLADKLAIDFSNNLASALWLIPLDPEFPILGGKTLKLSAGLELAYKNERPIVKLKGVSLWGVPLPNAWLGYSKNIDLVSEFDQDRGFWSAFANGIKELSVADGQLVIELNP